MEILSKKAPRLVNKEQVTLYKTACEISVILAVCILCFIHFAMKTSSPVMKSEQLIFCTHTSTPRHTLLLKCVSWVVNTVLKYFWNMRWCKTMSISTGFSFV